jgi:hypothetical protein
MSYQVIRIQKRPLIARLKFSIYYSYMNAKISLKYYFTGLKMIVLNEVLWCYDYTYKRIILINGIDYVTKVRVDLDEVVYLNTKEGVVRAEKF